MFVDLWENMTIVPLHSFLFPPNIWHLHSWQDLKLVLVIQLVLAPMRPIYLEWLQGTWCYLSAGETIPGPEGGHTHPHPHRALRIGEQSHRTTATDIMTGLWRTVMSVGSNSRSKRRKIERCLVWRQSRDLCNAAEVTPRNGELLDSSSLNLASDKGLGKVVCFCSVYTVSTLLKSREDVLLPFVFPETWHLKWTQHIHVEWNESLVILTTFKNQHYFHDAKAYLWNQIFVLSKICGFRVENQLTLWGSIPYEVLHSTGQTRILSEHCEAGIPRGEVQSTRKESSKMKPGFL